MTEEREQIAEDVRAAVVAEREAVVAWLRGEIETNYTDPQYDIGINLADAIKRGDHLPAPPHPPEDV